MLVPPTEGLKVVKYASGAGYAPDQWARALVAVDWSQAELLSDKPGSSVWRAELVVQKRPMTLVIKCEPIDSLKRKLQKLIHKTHAFRHWRGAALLMRHGFKTAEPKAIVYGRRDGTETECLIMESLAGKTVLQHLAAGDLGVGEEHAVARACGRMFAMMWDKALTNSDSKPSNLLLRQSGPTPELGVIDSVGVRAHREFLPGFDAVDDGDCWLMLRDLMLEPAGTGCLPRRSIRMRILRAIWESGRQREMGDSKALQKWRGWRREWWEQVESLVQAHGDPTPKHDPLGGAGSPPLQEN